MSRRAPKANPLDSISESTGAEQKSEIVSRIDPTHGLGAHLAGLWFRQQRKKERKKERKRERKERKKREKEKRERKERKKESF